MKKTVVFLALFAFMLVGCGPIKNILTTPGERSENYALDLHGGRATCPEMNDGTKYTGAKTKPLPMAVDDKNWREKEKFTQATVTLKEPKRINRVNIFSKDLDVVLGGMEVIVEYVDEDGNWKEIKRYNREKEIPKNIVISTNVFTDKVRIRIHRPSGLFSGGGGATGGAAMKDKGERTITEFELYGKIQKSESQKEEETK